MKVCPNCNTALQDNATFCTNCGAPAPQTPQQPQPPYGQAPYGQPPYYQATAYDPFDHTAEFDAQDIAKNKLTCMLIYLVGAIGIVLALLLDRSSPFVQFHVRQGLKFLVVEILTGLCAALLAWTIVVPLVCGIFAMVIVVIQIICFFQVAAGKAKEPAILRSIDFLK